jgi:hypothetical protein
MKRRESGHHTTRREAEGREPGLKTINTGRRPQLRLGPFDFTTPPRWAGTRAPQRGSCDCEDVFRSTGWVATGTPAPAGAPRGRRRPPAKSTDCGMSKQAKKAVTTAETSFGRRGGSLRGPRLPQELREGGDGLRRSRRITRRQGRRKSFTVSWVVGMATANAHPDRFLSREGRRGASHDGWVRGHSDAPSNTGGSAAHAPRSDYTPTDTDHGAQPKDGQ